MDGILSKIRSKAPGMEHSSAPTHTLYFCPSEAHLDLVNVHHANHPEHAPPIVTIEGADGMCMSEGPDYRFFQGGHLMGEAGFSLLSSKINLSLRGLPFQMKQSESSGNFSLYVPPLPPLKWKVNQLTRGSLQLRDDAGVKLAKIGKSSTSGGAKCGQKLEIFVPCDDFFVDLCIVSGYAAWILNKTTNEVVKEVAQAMVGAS